MVAGGFADRQNHPYAVPGMGGDELGRGPFRARKRS
jgi:hypothetical protein